MILPAENDVLQQIATVLNALGPFAEDTPRHLKWRTTEQLLSVLQQSGSSLQLQQLDELLERYEAVYRGRLKDGLEPEAAIRRAVYPDRTSALPMWGSTVHHGQPWLNQPSSLKTDPAQDLPDSRRVPDSAPRVFLSHAADDEVLAASIAETLAAMNIGAWMFETYLGSGMNIAASVRGAITQCDCCLILLTRTSIASLWVYTELSNAQEAGRPILLAIDSNDELMLRLLKTLNFNYTSGMYDFTFKCDETVVQHLQQAFATSGKADSRITRYSQQSQAFLATLPMYLEHLSAPAYAFPSAPLDWSGPILLADFAELRPKLQDIASSIARTSTPAETL